MKPRSHSLNQAVCVTMTAIEATPTTSVQMNATTCKERRAIDIIGNVLRCHGPRRHRDTEEHQLFDLRASVPPWLVSSERLTDREVDAPVAALGVAVDAEVVDGIDLVAEVDARG